MTITLHATGIEMSETLRLYAEEKIKSLEKFFDNIQKAEIDIGLLNHHHQKGKIYYAEVNVHVPGRVMRIVKEAEDLYKAIDKVKDHYKVEFDKMKGKLRAKDKKVLRENKIYQE